MKTVVHRSDTRGGADHGWLHARHSFSFADYQDPERMSFGLLRVLNDDSIEPSMGFSTHPHSNMEIVTIPLEGALRHKDSEGNEGVIKAGDVQVMSAGTGIRHSEHNASDTDKLNLFQIWVFPKEWHIAPRYDQKTLDVSLRKNKFHTIVSPHKNNDSVWINQDAFFSLADIDAGKEIEYNIQHSGNGAYVLVIDGKVNIVGEELNKRDAVGVTEAESLVIKADKKASILLIDVPMQDPPF